jgi:hypothetical protein
MSDLELKFFFENPLRNTTFNCIYPLPAVQ